MVEIVNSLVRAWLGLEWSFACPPLLRAGIEDFHWHALRHTWASWHMQSGTPLQVLQELGGWSSYEMVLRYARLSAAHLADYAERLCRPKAMDRTLSGTPGKESLSGAS